MGGEAEVRKGMISGHIKGLPTTRQSHIAISGGPFRKNL